MIEIARAAGAGAKRLGGRALRLTAAPPRIFGGRVPVARLLKIAAAQDDVADGGGDVGHPGRVEDLAIDRQGAVVVSL